MNYMFIPLEEHPDYGYGMIGSTYHRSARDLTSSEHIREDSYFLEFQIKYCTKFFRL